VDKENRYVVVYGRWIGDGCGVMDDEKGGIKRKWREGVRGRWGGGGGGGRCYSTLSTPPKSAPASFASQPSDLLPSFGFYHVKAVPHYTIIYLLILSKQKHPRWLVALKVDVYNGSMLVVWV